MKQKNVNYLIDIFYIDYILKCYYIGNNELNKINY